jgi:FkbM family methyltransferase
MGFLRRSFYRLLRPIHRYATIRLPCGIPITVDLAHWKWARIARRGYHELDTERFMAEYLRPGDVTVDAGANIGVLTTLAAKLVTDSGRVYAFEVDPLFFAELERTLERNSIHNVHAQRMALLDSPGEFTFVRPEGAWGSFLQRSGEQTKNPVDRPAIDSYFPDRAEDSYVCPATSSPAAGIYPRCR